MMTLPMAQLLKYVVTQSITTELDAFSVKLSGVWLRQ